MAHGLEAISPIDQHDERATVERARRGDKHAMAALYSSYAAQIRRYVHSRVPDADAADDLTAQVFLEALQGLPQYEPTGAPFLVWLYRIARAQTADHWRREKRLQEVTLTETLAAPEPVPDELFQNEDDWRAALDLLAELTDDQQNVVVMRALGGFSLAATAEALGKSLGAVKAIERRARATLARLRHN